MWILEFLCNFNSCQITPPFSIIYNFHLKTPEFFIQDRDCENFPELSHWNLKVVSPTGSEVFSLAANTKEVELQVERNLPTAILLSPVIKIPSSNGETAFEFFHPAGAIYPYTTSFSWLHGFSAKMLEKFILLSLKENSPQDVKNFLMHFNFQKFINSIEEKSLSKNYNPWNNDMEQITTSILNETFSLSLLNPKKELDISKKNLEINDTIVFSQYVPENSRDNFLISQNKLSTFIRTDQNAKTEILIVDAKDKNKITIKSFTR